MRAQACCASQACRAFEWHVSESRFDRRACQRAWGIDGEAMREVRAEIERRGLRRAAAPLAMVLQPPSPLLLQPIGRPHITVVLRRMEE